MSLHTEQKPPRPSLVADPDAELLAEVVAELRRTNAHLNEVEAKVNALTPMAVLSGIEAQVASARANLAETIKWTELASRMMTKLRALFSDMGVDDESIKLTASLPDAAAITTALQNPTSSSSSSSSDMEAMLGRLLNGVGLKP